MMLFFNEGQFADFCEVWDDIDGQDGKSLRRSLFLLYAVIREIWGITDTFIAEEMNKVIIDGDATSVRHDDIKVMFARIPEGRDLAINPDPDRLERNWYRSTTINDSKAWRLYLVLRQLVLQGEEVIPPYLREIAQERNLEVQKEMTKKLMATKKGRPSQGDIHSKRLENIKSSRKSILGQIQDIFSSFNEHFRLVKTLSREEQIGLSLFIRRQIELEVELFILNQWEKGEQFDWILYLTERSRISDESRVSNYTETQMSIKGLTLGENSALLQSLLHRRDRL